MCDSVRLLFCFFFFFHCEHPWSQVHGILRGPMAAASEALGL